MVIEKQRDNHNWGEVLNREAKAERKYYTFFLYPCVGEGSHWEFTELCQVIDCHLAYLISKLSVPNKTIEKEINFEA